jgi:hypothetical protein
LSSERYVDGDFLRAVLGSTKGMTYDASSIEAACRAHGLLKEGESLLAFTNLTPWVRGGAETFICTGALDVQSRERIRAKRHVIVKAYAGFGLGVPPDTRVAEWARRAGNLSAAGCPVSEVYGASSGLLFARYIPHSLLDVLMPPRAPTLGSWVAGWLERIGILLDRLSVAAVAILGDLRTDGTTVFLVDFGDDLGPVPGTSQDPYWCRRLLSRELQSASLADAVPYSGTSLEAS